MDAFFWAILAYGLFFVILRSFMLLVIDNFDSFTYNLVQYFGILGEEQRVFRNNEIHVQEALALNPDRVVISPGPCSPNEAGCSLEIIQAFAGKVPLLGVCLGHQSLGQVFGGKVVRAQRLMHGKTSPILHNGKGIFAGIPSPFLATRYHSLLVERESLPDCLEITAETAEGEIMGLQHKHLPVYGVQFHPESLATEHGLKLLQNFLEIPTPSLANA
jgi:anthranilate synthase/aminodeoxychorismate synthase-like glutamine amidotransferase